MDRPGPATKIIDQLCSEEGNRSSITAIFCAMLGMAGIGKTMLAVMLCHDRRVQRYFRTGGICWLMIGREPGDLLEKQRELLYMLGSHNNVTSLKQGQAGGASS